jgi:hypothetical protein
MPEITIEVDDVHAQLYEKLVERHGQEAVDSDLTEHIQSVIYGSVYNADAGQSGPE